MAGATKGRLSVPKHRAENPASGVGSFPPGQWSMEIEAIRQDTVDPRGNPKLSVFFAPNAKGNQRYAGPTAERLSLQLGKAEALAEGQGDPGAQKVFVELTIRDGDTRLDEVDVEAKGPGYQQRIDASLFANLAFALGQTYEEDGRIYVAEGFLDDLTTGGWVGVRVAASVVERSFTKRDGTPDSRVEVEAFKAL